MATGGGSLKFKLKKFSHFKQVSKKEAGTWTDYEADHSKPELMLNIAESGHVWVTQSQELLDFAILSGGASNVRVRQSSSDTLVIRSSIQGESRIMRLMFAGGSREEAVEQCSRAAARLKCPVEVPLPPPPPNQPPTEPCSSAAKQFIKSCAIVCAILCYQSNQTGPIVGTEPDVAQGSLKLSIRHLAQGLLGERTLSLPEMYQHCSEDLGPFVHMCLLDPAFPSYVGEVERELKKLAQD